MLRRSESFPRQRTLAHTAAARVESVGAARRMTLFAGVVALDGAPPVGSSEIADELCGLLSRHPGDSPERRTGPRHAIVWQDLGIHEGPTAIVGADGSLSILAGDPLCPRGEVALPRADALARLHEDWSRSETTTLRSARGAFCGIHFDAGTGRLWLLSDKLGLWPIYYYRCREYVVFATSMRALEGATLVPRHGDLQGVAETACFGYPLGGRSPIAGARAVEPAEIVEITRAGVRSTHYWTWDDVPSHDASPATICAALNDAFASAVRLRLGNRRRVPSMLSGGLDSRCVVAQLREAGADVDTINFGPEGSADLVLGREVARTLGTRHFEASRGALNFWDRLGEAHGRWIAAHRADYPDDRTPRQLWSGEGGDRVLAPVNLSHEVVAQMRAGNPAAAIELYMTSERVGLPRRLFRRGSRERIRALPRAGLQGELARRTHPDPGRRFHLYVLLTEARRNISRHFEDLDRHRVELVMPFYDSEMVRTALSYPLDPFIGHRLYYEWLTHHPPAVTAVPWQAYPTAPPCPLPLPPDVRLQWVGWYTPTEVRAQLRSHVSLADALLGAAHFPHWALSRPVLSVARVLLRLGMQRFAYLFEVAKPFVRYPPGSRSLEGV